MKQDYIDQMLKRVVPLTSENLKKDLDFGHPTFVPDLAPYMHFSSLLLPFGCFFFWCHRQQTVE